MLLAEDLGLLLVGLGVSVGYCPHTVIVYNRATIKVLIYLYYEYDSTITEWGQYPTYNSFRIH